MNNVKKDLFFGLKCTLKRQPGFILLVSAGVVLTVAMFGFRIAEFNSAKVEK
jgi:hypothetical protein